MKPVVFDITKNEKPTLNNTIGKSSKCMRKIQQHLVPHAIAYLGTGWSSVAAGGAVSSILQYIVQTQYIGGLESQYEKLMTNDPDRDIPLIRKLRNGHNKTNNFHRDAVTRSLQTSSRTIPAI